MIRIGSRKLFEATQNYSYIHSVNILLPVGWDVEGAIVSSEYFYEDGDVRVNLQNPLYQDTPYTVQPGGCGDRGDYIHLTPDFLRNMNTSSMQFFGPADKIFVHEWAKLRYGVFEEYGYPGDEQFPLFYYEIGFDDGGTTEELTPNFDTDAPFRGTRE